MRLRKRKHHIMLLTFRCNTLHSELFFPIMYHDTYLSCLTDIIEKKESYETASVF